MTDDITKRCIICLEKEKKYVPSTKLYHIPCECHIYIHYSCFRQCHSDKCLICKREYQKEKLDEFNMNIKNYNNTVYPNIYHMFYCLMYFIGYLSFFFIAGFTVIIIGYGVGYFFSCINQLFDNGNCNKIFFEGTHLYIGIFVIGILMACRAEAKDRQKTRIMRRRSVS